MERLTNATSSILAIVILLGVIVLIALSQPVPGELWSAFGVVIGFFFGSNKPALKA